MCAMVFFRVFFDMVYLKRGLVRGDSETERALKKKRNKIIL